MSYHGSGNYIVLLLFISKIKYSFYRKQYETSQGINICDSKIFDLFILVKNGKALRLIDKHIIPDVFQKKMSRKIRNEKNNTLVISAS